MFIAPSVAVEKGYIKGTHKGLVRPASIDLELKEVYRLGGSSFLRREARQLLKHEKMEPRSQHGVDTFIFGQFETYHFFFNQSIELPQGVIAQILSRSTLARAGLVIPNNLWDPGFKGELGVLGFSTKHISVEVGFPIAQIVFQTTDSKEMYEGFWQGKKYE